MKLVSILLFSWSRNLNNHVYFMVLSAVLTILVILCQQIIMQTLQSANEVLHEGNQYQLFKLNVV